MKNRSAELKRIGIFLLFSFSLAWIPWILLNKYVGFETWMTDAKYTGIGILLMFPPAVANFLTRLVTKEGWEDSYLHLRLEGNIVPYILSIILIPLVNGLAAPLLTAIWGSFDDPAWRENFDAARTAGNILSVFSTGAVLAFYTFGEEFGWRGYLYPKLEKFLGTAPAGIIGGIIWGLWHVPLTIAGHNFGKDYTGYPYTGILLMCILCTFEGFFLMWLTRRTGSVYPASITHAVINNGGMIILMLFVMGFENVTELTISMNAVALIPTVIMGSTFFFILLRENKKKKAAVINNA